MPSQTSSSQKILRVGVFQGERCIEERLIRKRAPITIGQTLSNTFVVPTSAMPKTFKLFDVTSKGEFVLRFNDRMGGRMSLGGNDMIDVTRPRQSKHVRASSDGEFEITLTEGARGKITIGDTRILFNFVASAAARGGAIAGLGGPISQIIDLVDMRLVGAMLIAFIIEAVPIGGIVATDWPIPEDYPLIPPWKDQITIDYERPEEKKEEPKPEETIPEETTPTDAVPTDEPKVEDTPKEPPKAAPRPKAPAARPSAGPKEKKAAARSQGRSLVAAKFAVDGGAGGYAGATIGSQQASAMLDNLSRSDLSGPAKGGAASMLTSLGDGDGTGGPGGNPGLKEVGGLGGPGGNVVSGGGPATGQPAKREVVEIKVKDSEKAKFKGSLSAGDQQSIESVFKRYKGQIENCYKRVISAKGDKRGKLSVIVNISAKGDVLDVKIHTNEVDPSLEQCVVPKIKSWKFPSTGKPSQAMKSWVFGN
jgi:outer membrane biosynthesis protein TonB